MARDDRVTATEAPSLALPRRGVHPVLPYLVTGAAFVLLFMRPAALLARDWWTNPEAGHGLLLAPVAIWLAWKRGWAEPARPWPVFGAVLLAFAVLARGAADLAAELFVMRASMLLAAVALVVYFRGVNQLRVWWLPALLIALTIPLPELVTSAIALPLQFRASAMGARLLEWRDVPVLLSGNIIQLPGRQLFVTEACSGLRSLTALLSVSVLMGGLWLESPVSRVFLVAVGIPIAIAINGVRVFLTGFLVYFVDPKLGEGFLHLTEGWLLFLVSLSLIALAAAAVRAVERKIRPAKAA